MNAVQTTGDTQPKRFQFVGGALCLDFCNSVGGKRGIRPKEYLNSYADFLSWSQQANLVAPVEAQQLLRKGSREPAAMSSALKRAIRLREAIYRIFLSRIDKKNPLESDISQLNAELGRSLNRLQVSSEKKGFGWKWNRAHMLLDFPLGPIARSAADLLTSSEENIRQCHGENCGWLFVDSSKNHSRCWCDMRDCGNRAKVRRHRLRKRHDVG